jgi:hypothetical protein
LPDARCFRLRLGFPFGDEGLDDIVVTGASLRRGSARNLASLCSGSC